MKNLVITAATLAGLAFALSYLQDRFALTATELAVAIASVLFLTGLGLFALADYAHKPRFRVRRPRPEATAVQPAATADSELLWTYTTRSS